MTHKTIVAIAVSAALVTSASMALAESPDGKLIIVEDNVPSDIWFAGKDHDNDGMADGVWLFGSLSDRGAEGTGIYFGKDPKTLLVNLQHSAADDGDASWAISPVK